ncbi:carbohydrate-binding family V/XII [Ancylobacter lacus]|uniref:carbohydrate-binding family V/XII n=1 Tax=Ancylobacter lacus TaxID=2579970 RepID=UPI001BD16582|nr:carbohydrate-binding family V/XII [Ancylobacter lacus]MBS7540211.1 carbohydrate-binding family V/XII [Ancylobacter lacus]
MLKHRLRLAAFAAATALVVPALVLSAAAPAAAQTAAPADTSGQDAAAGLAWPRTVSLGDNNVLRLYQPLIEDWNGDRLKARAAIAIGPADGSPTYGIAHFTARVAVDKATRVAQLSEIEVASVDVPTDPSQQTRLLSALQSRLPSDGITVALDHLLTSYTASKQITKDLGQPVENTPPRILFANTPTLLVLVSGDPVLRPIDGAQGYQRVANTRALVIVDPAGGYHLQAAGRWYQAAGLAGPWSLTTTPNPAVEAAGGTANYAQPAESLMPPNGKPPAQPPAVIVATQPTELVVTQGAPQMVPVDGTTLLRMANADHGVLLDPSSNAYYVLVSGRWFKGPALAGPWSFVPADQIPPSFAKISDKDPAANVLVSVPGTPQAKEAVIAATVPQTASISRKATLTVEYDGGTPRFVPISGTILSYAENSRTPVIRLDAERYYAVSRGAWFVASSPNGPWAVADVVPAAIYTIPVSSPLHYVTYVRVYSYTPDYVVAGYTPGYLGVTIAPYGTVVYGTGSTCSGYVGTYWYGCPATYGYNAGFQWVDGFGFGFAAGWWGGMAPYWGPYWGPGPWGGTWNAVNVNQTNIYGQWGGNATVNRVTGYNAWTGNEWARSSWAGVSAGGTSFAGRSAAAFNPWTGNYAAGAENERYNPSTGAVGASRAGIVGNVDSGNFAAGRQSAGYNPTTGMGHVSETGVTDNNGNLSVDSRGVAGNAKTGNGVAWNDGNIYTDHDGTVHQYDGSNWQRQTTSGWQQDTDADQINRLNTQRQYQSFGNDRVNSFASDGGWSGYHSDGGWGGDRSFGGGDFGGGRFGGGFGGGFRR